MPNLAARIDTPMFVRADATPPLARMSTGVLSQLLLLGSQDVQKSLPVANTQTGNLFQDRFDSNLRWYTPSYVLAPDPDALFSFAASQSGVDASGNPFNKGRLTLALKKVVPDDISVFKAANPDVQLREIQVTGLSAYLTVTFKDSSTGQDQQTSYCGVVTVQNEGDLQLTFDNILGVGVIILYENLVRAGGAEVSISGTYDVWRRIGRTKIFLDRRLAMTDSLMAAERPPARMSAFKAALVLSSPSPVIGQAVQPSMVFHAPTRSFPAEPPDPTDNNQFQQGTSTIALRATLGTKYAANAYALKFTVGDGSVTRPIINVNDLKNYNVKQSEFTELKTLGDISQRYPSLNRMYLGVLSKTIVVIPSCYAIVRSTHGAGARCEALLDSAASAVNKCKFQFTFLLAPDVSPIDLLQLSQEVTNHPDLHGYSLKLPDFLKEGTIPKLLTAFQSSCQYSGTSDLHTFALAVEIEDGGTDSPAVANANLLIKQLCSQNQPFLFATLSLKLDDYYPEAVQATAVLNFRETSGTDELTFSFDEGSQTVNFLNRSPFDLILSRYALCTPNGISIFSTNQTVTSNNSTSVPLPADHNGLSVLVDRELAVEGAISKDEIGKFLVFQTKDVQNTQYALGVNANSVRFDARGISQIDVQVSLSDLPDIAVPNFSLVNLRKVDGTTVLVPLQNAISGLHAALLFTIHHVDSQQRDAKFTLQHDFMDEPILILKDSDLDVAIPP